MRRFQKRLSRLFAKTKVPACDRSPETNPPLGALQPAASWGARGREDRGARPPWSSHESPVLHSHPPVQLRGMKLPRKLHLLRFVVTQVYTGLRVSPTYRRSQTELL